MTTQFKTVVIDCKGHLVGRLASKVAKELLSGTHIVAVRCEELNITGSLFRNRLKYQAYLNKRVNTNPVRGPFHHRAPSRMFYKAVRGMLPHKSARGAAALSHLRVFEGVPPPFDKLKKVVVPEALRVTRLTPGRLYARLGDLASSVGWKHGGVVAKLEDKRKKIGASYHARKLARNKLRTKAVAEANSNQKLGAVSPILKAYGF